MRSRIVLVAGTLMVLGAAVAVVAALVETDEERIEKLVEEMRVAALDRDVPGLLAGVSEDVEYPGGREALRRRIESVLERHPPDHISVELRDLEVDGDGAEAEVEVWYTTRTLGGRPGRVTFRTRFGRGEDGWRVVGLATDVGG